MPGPFAFGAPGTATTQANSSFSFGAAKTTAPTLNLTNPAAATGTAATGTAAAGFNFGLGKTTASTSLFGTPASTASSGFGFGTTPTSSASTGFTLKVPAPTSTAATAGPGFAFGKTTTSSTTPGFGGVGLLGNAPAPAAAAAATTTASMGLGTGLFGTQPAARGGTSIFNSLPTSSAATGLGGVDPNTALKTGAGDGRGAASDGKTPKESFLPEPLTGTVDALQKFVKEEKSVREDIARMSSKPMLKVQEEVTALRQLLSVVSNGLQRNVCSVDKLKAEMTQKLKNAEMSQRTKEIPAGLPYENTAPTEYFHHLVQEFEERMVTYRQQIETLDSHLAALHQTSSHTPSEMLALLKKLHETFISLAAQLQAIHEQVKSQKDQYLTYHRVFHGDAKNIFHKPTPAPKVAKKTELSDLAGPNPFPGTTNAAARAMAIVQNMSQQPQGPPVTGLVLGNTSGFGASPFGGGIFGAAKPIQNFGATSLTGPSASIGGVGNLFSSTGLGSSPATGCFGTPATLGTSTTAALNLAGTNLNMSAANGKPQPFQLQKPPQGPKRGKR